MIIDANGILDHAKQADGAGTTGKAVIQGADPANRKAKPEQGGKSLTVSPGSYEKPSNTQRSAKDEVEEKFSSMDAKARKEEMTMLASTASETDIRKMEEEGFSIESEESSTIVTVVDKIKTNLVKAGVDISCMGDDLSIEQLEALGGNEAYTAEVIKQLKQADLPMSPDTIQEMTEAGKLAAELKPLKEDGIRYLLSAELMPTIENLYRAEYSTGGGYPAGKEQNIDYDAIMPQIEKVIKEAGKEENPQNIQDSKWLIQNGIGLTPENLSYYQDLKQMELPPDGEKVMELAVKAMSENARPKDAFLIEGYSLEEQAESAMQAVAEATDEDLAYLSQQGEELTVENLKHAIALRKEGGIGDTGQIQEVADTIEASAAGKISGDAGEAGKQPDTEITRSALALITARRQMEEVRLVMTTEANLGLLKYGVAIDTKPMEVLVEKLKIQENRYQAVLFGEKPAAEPSGYAAIFEETEQYITDLKGDPAYALGRLDSEEVLNLRRLHDEGSALKDNFAKANESYETMMTAPRQDMGDSIEKAFQNVDDILEDMGMKKNAANERAVRILAYNELPLTEESVTTMKAMDEKVQRAFQNLTPAVVRDMIKEGSNPLDMQIDDLNQAAENLKQENGMSEERFSKYLYQLDQAKEISQEERSAFLGIYRLINQVEKTDGAAIGALVNQGADLTMRNLLTAVRNSKKAGSSYQIDDSFGEAQQAGHFSNSITDQIEKGYQTDCMKDVLDHMTPSALKSMVDSGQFEESTPEQVKEEILSQPKKEETEQAYVKKQVEEFSNVTNIEDDVYEFLSDHQMPNTLYHVLAADEMIHQRNKVFSRLFSYADRAESENSDFKEIQNGILEKFADALETPEEMAKAQKALADTAENVMKTMIEEKEDITSLDIRELRLMNTQISIAGKMGQEENYAIPVLVGDEVTNVSLKIVRGKEKKGTVDILFETKKYGKVAASFEVKDGEMSGLIATNSRLSKEILERNQDKMKESFREGGEASAQLNFLFSSSLDLNKIGDKKAENANFMEQSGTESDAKTATTRLYHIAKSFLNAVKEVESGADI